MLSVIPNNPKIGISRERKNSSVSFLIGAAPVKIFVAYVSPNLLRIFLKTSRFATVWGNRTFLFLCRYFRIKYSHFVNQYLYLHSCSSQLNYFIKQDFLKMLKTDPCSLWYPSSSPIFLAQWKTFWRNEEPSWTVWVIFSWNFSQTLGTAKK